jgi:hypothetical protein
MIDRRSPTGRRTAMAHAKAAQDLGRRGSRMSRLYHPQAATTLTPSALDRQSDVVDNLEVYKGWIEVNC